MDDELRFDGRTVLVTGSSRNIGKAVVLEFAARGANVVVNTRSNRDEAEQAAAEAAALGAKTLVVLGDPSEKAVVETMRDEAERVFGGVDIYVSNAARRLHKTFDELTDDDWHYYLNQQLTASWYLAKAFAPGMKARGWGRIIHINGEDGWLGGATRIPHSTAKAGLRTLTKSLASALGPYGITVNDVSPGFMDTIRDPETHPGFTRGEAQAERWVSEIPIGRQPTVQELAWAVVFFAAPRSAALNGTVLHVDGGERRLG